MYKEVLRTIAGIEVFPVVSLLIFLTVFVVMLVWVIRLDGQQLAACANLPLEDRSAPESRRQKDADRGVRS